MKNFVLIAFYLAVTLVLMGTAIAIGEKIVKTSELIEKEFTFSQSCERVSALRSAGGSAVYGLNELCEYGKGNG